jgi:hypothetical protein
MVDNSLITGRIEYSNPHIVLRAAKLAEELS